MAILVSLEDAKGLVELMMLLNPKRSDPTQNHEP